MLPPNIGDGVLRSSSGGVNPTGASFVAISSVAFALMVHSANFYDLKLGSVTNDDCFQGTATRSTDFGAESVAGVKREACVVIAIENWDMGKNGDG